MSKVKLSSKFQIVIPREVRKKLDLKPGESIVIVEKAGTIHLVTQKPIQCMRGFVKTGKVENIREETNRI
jgi:AbrB family looped-hinge helix DNA binding protein